MRRAFRALAARPAAGAGAAMTFAGAGGLPSFRPAAGAFRLRGQPVFDPGAGQIEQPPQPTSAPPVATLGGQTYTVVVRRHYRLRRPPIRRAGRRADSGQRPGVALSPCRPARYWWCRSPAAIPWCAGDTLYRTSQDTWHHCRGPRPASTTSAAALPAEGRAAADPARHGRARWARRHVHRATRSAGTPHRFSRPRARASSRRSHCRRRGA